MDMGKYDILRSIRTLEEFRRQVYRFLFRTHRHDIHSSVRTSDPSHAGPSAIRQMFANRNGSTQL
jgi:hypothetical protein